MIRIERDVDARDLEPWRLYCAFDLHVGSRECDEAAVGRYLKRVECDAHGLVLFGGDQIKAFSKKDLRFVMSQCAPWVLQEAPLFGDDVISIEMAHWQEMVKPVAAKAIGLLKGNHEHTPECWTGRAVAQEMARTAGMPYLGWQGLIRLVFQTTKTQRHRFYVYAHHGWRVGDTPDTAKAAMRVKLGQVPEARIAVCGHQHGMTGDLVPAATWMGQQDRAIGVAGCFERTMTDADLGYSDMKGHSPKLIGGLVFEWNPRTDGLKVIEEAA